MILFVFVFFQGCSVWHEFSHIIWLLSLSFPSCFFSHFHSFTPSLHSCLKFPQKRRTTTPQESSHRIVSKRNSVIKPWYNQIRGGLSMAQYDMLYLLLSQQLAEKYIKILLRTKRECFRLIFLLPCYSVFIKLHFKVHSCWLEHLHPSCGLHIFFACTLCPSLSVCSSTQPTHIAIFYLWLLSILSSCINFVVHCFCGWCVCIYYLSILSSSPFKWSHLCLYPHFSLFCNQTALKAHESNISHPLPSIFSLLSNLVGTVQWQISCSASIRLVTELSLALFTQNCQALCDVSVLIHTYTHTHTHRHSMQKPMHIKTFFI